MIGALEEELVLEQESTRQSLLRHRNDAYLLALRLAGNEADAEDAVQDAYLQAFQSRTEILDPAGQRKWLLTIVANCVKRVRSRDKQRKAREQRRSQMEENVQAAPLENMSEVREMLSNAIQELDANQRVSVSLHHEFGLSYAEASGICGIPVGNMRVYAQRGLDALRQKLTVAGYSLSPVALVTLLGEPAGCHASTALQMKLNALASQPPTGAHGTPLAKIARPPLLTLKTVAIVGGLALVFTLCALIPGRHAASKGDETPAPAPTPVPSRTAANDLFANASAKLSKILNLRVDVAYNHDTFGEVVEDLKERVGLQTASVQSGRATAVVNRAFMFSMTQRDVPVRTVLTALAERGGLSLECHGDAVAFWKRDDAAITKLSEKLRNGTIEERCSAAHELGGLNDPRIYKPLLLALRDKDEAVVAWATSSLGRAESAVAYGEYADADLAPLIEKLRGPEADPRLIDVAGKSERDVCAAPLIALTRSPHTQTQLYAIMALGNLHTAAALDTVLEFAAAKSSRLRSAAFLALWNSREPRAVTAINKRFAEAAEQEKARQAPQRQVIEFSSQPTPQLGAISLDTPDVKVVQRTMSAIETELAELPWRVHTPFKQELVKRAQTNGAAPQEVHLPGILLDCSDQQAEELVARLDTPEFAHNFRILRLPAIAKAFARTIQLGSAARAERGIVLAESMRSPAALDAIAQKLNQDRSAKLLDFASKSWWFLGEGLGGEMLLAYTGQTMPPAATFEIGTADFAGASKAFDALAWEIEHGAPEQQAKALGLIGHLQDRRALPLLERAVQSGTQEARTAAISGLGWSDFPEAVPILLKHCGDADPTIRALILDALEQFDDPRGLARAHAMFTDADAKVRERAAKCLGMSFLPQAGNEIRAAAESKNPLERASAAMAMAELTDARRIGDLLKLLEDPVPDVRVAAVQALWEISGTKGVEVGPEVFVSMTAHARNDESLEVQLKCMNLMSHFGNSEPVEIELLSHAKPQIRIMAAKCLESTLEGFMGIQRAVDPEKIKSALTKYVADHPGEYAPRNFPKPEKNDF